MLLPWGTKPQKRHGGGVKSPSRRLELEALENRTVPASITVTGTGDTVAVDNVVTLREAIASINAGANVSDVVASGTYGVNDNIFFHLGPTPTIAVTAALPAINKPVFIDGWTQSNGNPGVWVELDGNQTVADGLTFNTGGCEVRGLAIDLFDGNGIVLNNPIGTTNTIYSCNIGTDLTGTAGTKGNAKNGILVEGPSNAIGHISHPNVISGNVRSGIYITGANAKFNTVVGNYIGVDDTGIAPLGNVVNGVFIDGANNNTIGGVGVDPANVISGNSRQGVYIQNSSNTQLLGNYIGLGSDGTTVVGNGDEGVVLVNSGTGNRIGTAQAGNVISGNFLDGVSFNGGAQLSGNFVLGNLIGTDKTGTVAKGNLDNGIYLSAPSNSIGGVNPGEANTISGNHQNGVKITGATTTGNNVLVNRIGTNVTGTAAVANVIDGIFIAANNNTIGAAGANNNTWSVISGNGNAGIEIVGGNTNTVVHCFIGTDSTGSIKIANAQNGVVIGNNTNASNSNTIGGLADGTLNVISGNTGYGIAILGPANTGSTGNNIFGNYIGTDSAGGAPLGNSNDGVYVEVNSNHTTIDGNVISANGGAGVWMDGSNNLVKNNKIGLDKAGNVVMGLANDGGWRGANGGDPEANGNVWQNNQHN
jgi:parallel beta-helix repeat protein